MDCIVNLSLRTGEFGFGDNRKQELLYRLARISGSDPHGISIVAITRGCINLTLRLGTREGRELVAALTGEGEATLKLTADQILDLIEIRREYDVASIRMAGQMGKKRKTTPKRPGKIFFVHGWTGGDATFGLLPEFVENITGCSTSPYSYPSGVFQESSRIPYISRNFDNHISEELEADPCEFGIVCHSMGGVITRGMISSSSWERNEFSHLLRMVTFIASPQIGTWLARFARHIPGSVFRQSQDLDPSSPILSEITMNWNLWLDERCAFRSNVRSILSDADQIAPPASATGSDGRPIVVLGLTHKNIVKPKKSDDQIVKSVCRLIRKSGLADNG
ncbi:MAG: hypothetical protein AAGL23_07845 [Pseudomonadota bacterium]